MPLVRVEIPHGHSDGVKKALWTNLKAAIDRALSPGGKSADPRVTKYEYVSISEVYAEVGAGAPTGTVDLWPGREAERKAALATAVGEVFSETMGIDPGDVYLLFREEPASEHFCGGKPLPEWEPS